MNNVNNSTQTPIVDLTSRIAELIEELRRTNPDDIKFLEPCHASIINIILKQYKFLKRPQEGFQPTAEMIYLAAPTGAGKDSLVKRIMRENPHIDYAVLNMDMFRHYHNKIIGTSQRISDKHYATTTNPTSYEIYFLIQELILRDFPGTNVIITGTMRNLDWVKEIANRYRSDPKTNYKTTLVALAVPRIQSAFSIFERYLEKVNASKEDSEQAVTPALRYTSLLYHDNTVDHFTKNIGTVENELRFSPQTSCFERIKVYRRAIDILNPDENTLLYDSNNPNQQTTAAFHVLSIMNSVAHIPPQKMQRLLDMIEANKQYLISQDLYQVICEGIAKIQQYLLKKFKDDEVR